MSNPKAPESPCQSVCHVNEAAVCVGCGRTLDEIGDWLDADVERKQEIVELAAERLKAIVDSW